MTKKIRIPKKGDFIVVDEWLYGLAANPPPYGYVSSVVQFENKLIINFEGHGHSIHCLYSKWRKLPKYAIPGWLSAKHPTALRNMDNGKSLEEITGYLV